jgi:ArsR family transcriptional regulator
MSTFNPLTPTIEKDDPPLPLEGLVRICTTLGHPAHLPIIAFLKAENQCFCGQLVNRLPLAQSTVSQHLKYLKEAGVITGETEGAGTGYCLNQGMLRQLKNSLARFLD